MLSKLKKEKTGSQSGGTSGGGRAAWGCSAQIRLICLALASHCFPLSSPLPVSLPWVSPSRGSRAHIQTHVENRVYLTAFVNFGSSRNFDFGRRHQLQTTKNHFWVSVSVTTLAYNFFSNNFKAPFTHTMPNNDVGEGINVGLVDSPTSRKKFRRQQPQDVFNLGRWRWSFQRISVAYLTVNAGKHDPGVVVRDDVSVAVLRFVDLQVGILPCELLAGVNRLSDSEERKKKGQNNKHRQWNYILILCCFFNKKHFLKIIELMSYLPWMYSLPCKCPRESPRPAATENVQHEMIIKMLALWKSGEVARPFKSSKKTTN